MPTDSLLHRATNEYGRLAPVDSLGQLITDGGPVYLETDLNHLIAEPWNAVSAAIFIGIAGYWVYKLRGQFLRFPFLSLSLLLLGIGGVGGTLYHAFRQSETFLLMDWLPILLICVATSAYFVRKAAGKWWPILAIYGIALLLEYLNIEYVGLPMGVNVSYGIMAGMVILPTLWVLIRTRFQHAYLVALAFVSFVAALSFRLYDLESGWPMGTHFLWHSFGAVACHAMFVYTHRLYQIPLPTRS